MSVQPANRVAESGPFAEMSISPALLGSSRAGGGWALNSGKGEIPARADGSALSSAVALERRSAAWRIYERRNTTQTGTSAYPDEIVYTRNSQVDRMSRSAARTQLEAQQPLTYNLHGKALRADILAMFVDVYA